MQLNVCGDCFKYKNLNKEILNHLNNLNDMLKI